MGVWPESLSHQHTGQASRLVAKSSEQSSSVVLVNHSIICGHVHIIYERLLQQTALSGSFHCINRRIFSWFRFRALILFRQERGMSRQDAEDVIEKMAKYDDFFVNLMMNEELGLQVCPM